MKILVLGASGIIGQHMMLSKPEGLTAYFFRRKMDQLFGGVDITNPQALLSCLEALEPDAVVNLAGESGPDIVEREPATYKAVNVEAPRAIARWCDAHQTHYVHVSSQAALDPVNAYGKQKAKAEKEVAKFENWTIARPTFVLGVRPLPHVGRPNPIEQMLGGQRKQVNDRWFSPSFAWDVAAVLWKIAQDRPLRRVLNLGNPISTNRWKIARSLGLDVEGVPHNSFKGIAPRPLDTSYGRNAFHRTNFWAGLDRCRKDFGNIRTGGSVELDLSQRAKEIALFLGINEDQAHSKLSRGFGALHGEVAADFRRDNPQGDAELLDWYRRTEAYIWELSAYHADPGFNYSGMCQGVAERLKAAGCHRVLCLGDGVGDLTLRLRRAGFEAVYHDLAGSRTAEFAQMRARMYLDEAFEECMTSSWAPELPAGEFDAIISLDFLEHVTDVPAWTLAIGAGLKPGGLFCAQNAFGCGSGPDGSIPMHLARNDRFEKDWDPHLASIGFVQESSNWYRWPAKAEAAG